MARSRFNTARLRGAGVIAYDPLQISGILPGGTVGQAYSFTPGTSGGSGTKTFALTGSLPSGLSFNTSTGAITGTPTAAGTTSGLTIAVTDTSGTAKLTGLSITVTKTVAASVSVRSTVSMPKETYDALAVKDPNTSYVTEAGTYLGSTLLSSNSSSLASYLGQVATRGRVGDSFAAPNKQIMSATKHFARDNMNGAVAIFANWSRTSEAASGAAATITASVEYPSGTFTRVTFGGLTSGTIPDGGTITTDPLPTIPRGASFYFWTYFTCTAGIIYTSGNDATDRSAFGASGIVDYTAAGATTGQLPLGSVIYAPMAIIGQTTRPAILVIGDSNGSGFADGSGGFGGDNGMLVRPIGPSLAYIQATAQAESLQNFISNSTKRRALLTYCSHVIINLGINDVARAGTTMRNDLVSIINLLAPAGKPIWLTTLMPYATSTDSFITTANQTTQANNANRVAYNNLIRGGIAGATGYFDIADAVESARDSGLWRVDGGAHTADGLHVNPRGSMAIQAAGKINPAVFL